MSNENFINQRVQIPPSTCNPSSSNVLSRNFSKPPDNSIGSPTLFSGAYPAQVQLGRVAFSFINAGAFFFMLWLLMKIFLFKELIVYENNLFILGFEILICLVMFILNFKEGLR